jgi:Flp pilus assembly pilin Flp
MDRINTLVVKLQNRKQEGQAMVEYGLILGLVSVVGIAALVTIGGSLDAAYTAVTDALATAGF